MPRTKPPPSELLPGFAAPTRDEAMKLVARIPLGSSLRHELTSCGRAQCKPCKKGPSHGPYWYAKTPQKDGKQGRRVYVGNDVRKRRLELAWELVAKELADAQASAEAVPEVKRLRSLEALTGGRRALAKAPPDVVDVPILAMGGAHVPKD